MAKTKEKKQVLHIVVEEPIEKAPEPASEKQIQKNQDRYEALSYKLRRVPPLEAYLNDWTSQDSFDLLITHLLTDPHPSWVTLEDTLDIRDCIYGNAASANLLTLGTNHKLPVYFAGCLFEEADVKPLPKTVLGDFDLVQRLETERTILSWRQVKPKNSKLKQNPNIAVGLFVQPKANAFDKQDMV